MTTPGFADYRTNGQPIIEPSTGVVTVPAETVWERILACLSVLASGQNPDGSTGP